MLRFDASLLALACDFVGTWVPYQGIELAPLAGGVSIAATNRGAVAMIAFDPNGSADETTVLLPGGDLAKACRGIKTASREVTLHESTAVVTTYRKSTNSSVELPITRSSIPFPNLTRVITTALQYWGTTPTASSTAGRYELPLLTKALRAMADDSDSIVLSAFQGGPLRLQREDSEIVILLMPQAAEPIPPVPSWLESYAQRDSATQSSLAVAA